MKVVAKRDILKVSALSAVLAILSNAANPAYADDAKQHKFRIFPNRKIAQSFVPPLVSSKEKGGFAPGEAIYFPTNTDGTPFVLDIDTTVNFTDAVNRFYYEPKWRGEVWAPFNQWSLIERSTRLMSTWPEYDEFSQYRKLNHVHKFFERYSGFGP